MIYGLVLVLIYLVIGVLLSGLFNDLGIDAFYWILAWPVVVLIIIALIITLPFENLECTILEKIKNISKRKRE